MKLLDFAIPKANDDDENHSNCQSKKRKQRHSGEPVPVPIGPSVVLGEPLGTSVEFFPSRSEAPIQFLFHRLKFSSCGFITRLRSRKICKILLLH